MTHMSMNGENSAKFVCFLPQNSEEPRYPFSAIVVKGDSRGHKEEDCVLHMPALPQGTIPTVILLPGNKLG